MFSFHKKARPKTILLNSHSVLTGNELTVDAIWQQRHATSNLAQVMGQTINHADTPIDAALTHYMSIRALTLATHQPIHEFAFSHETGASGTVTHHGEAYRVAIKGMPERVLEYCDISDNEREGALLQLHTMSSKGLSVVALASGVTLRPIKHISGLQTDEKLTFVGLIGIKLGISSIARQCVAEATAQGISLYLSTGLHPTAAYSLASQIGIASQPSEVYDARHLDIIRPEEVITLVTGSSVFARATAEQKSRIQMAIQAIDTTTATVNTIEEFAKLLEK